MIENIRVKSVTELVQISIFDNLTVQAVWNNVALLIDKFFLTIHTLNPKQESEYIGFCALMSIALWLKFS